MSETPENTSKAQPVSKAKRVVVPEELREIRSVPTFTGRVDEDTGKDHVTFPAWYARTGVRTAEIDTGLGVVMLRAVMFDREELESNVGWLKLSGAILRVPEWAAEYDMEIKGDKETLKVAEGDTIPSPREIHAKGDPLLARRYWEECLPPSLSQQVIAATMFMQLPPIAHVPKSVDPRGE